MEINFEKNEDATNWVDIYDNFRQADIIKREEIGSRLMKQPLHQLTNKDAFFDLKKATENMNRKLKIKDDAPEWAKELNDGGKKVFYTLFSKFNCTKIPTMEGHRGISVGTTAFLVDIAPFLFNYKEVEREISIEKSKKQSEPHTGRDYLVIRFKMTKEEQVEKFFDSFFEDSPSLHTIWLMRLEGDCSRYRSDFPTSECAEFFNSDQEDLVMRKRTSELLFPGSKGLSRTKTAKLFIDKDIPFQIVFTLNLETFGKTSLKETLENGEFRDLGDLINPETHLVAGELAFNFTFENEEDGVSKGKSRAAQKKMKSKRKSKKNPTKPQAQTSPRTKSTSPPQEKKRKRENAKLSKSREETKRLCQEGEKVGTQQIPCNAKAEESLEAGTNRGGGEKSPLKSKHVFKYLNEDGRPIMSMCKTIEGMIACGKEVTVWREMHGLPSLCNF